MIQLLIFHLFMLVHTGSPVRKLEVLYNASRKVPSSLSFGLSFTLKELPNIKNDLTGILVDSSYIYLFKLLAIKLKNQFCYL